MPNTAFLSQSYLSVTFLEWLPYDGYPSMYQGDPPHETQHLELHPGLKTNKWVRRSYPPALGCPHSPLPGIDLVGNRSINDSASELL